MLWTLGKEKEVQLELAVLGDSVSIKDYVDFAYQKLISEPRTDLKTSDKLYELLVTSITYGENEKELQLECPYCKKASTTTIDVFHCIKYIPGVDAPDINAPASEFVKSTPLAEGIRLEVDTHCIMCKNPIKIIVTPEDIFKSYIFSYDILQYYKLIHFFKKIGGNYSITEIENMTYLELKILKNIVLEDMNKKEGGVTNIGNNYYNI